MRDVRCIVEPIFGPGVDIPVDAWFECQKCETYAKTMDAVIVKHSRELSELVCENCFEDDVDLWGRVDD